MRAMSNYHPVTSFLFYFGAFILVMSIQSLPLTIGCLVMLVLINKWQDPRFRVFSFFIQQGWMSLVIFVINVLMNHRGTHPLFYLGKNPIMLEAVIRGLIMGASILCLILIFTSLNLILTTGKILFLFGKVVPRFTLLTVITLRFMPLLRKRFIEIKHVQDMKGLSITTGRFRGRLRHGIMLIQLLLTFSLEEALQTADSMESRGFGLDRKRTSYVSYRFNRKDTFWCLIFFALILMYFILRRQFYPDTPFFGYTMITLDESLFPKGQAIWLIVLSLVYFSCPFFIEGRERIRWYFYKLKT